MNEVIKKPSTKQSEQDGVEGEGSCTATHHYDEGVRESVKKGTAEELGRAAEKALDGSEGKELRDAEAAAKKGQSLKK